MAYSCGNDGYVEVGGVRLDVTSWEADENSDWTEVTNTASGGYKQSISCKKYLTGTVNANFDPALGPKGAPVIAAGTVVSLVLHTQGAESYTINTANVTRLHLTTPAGDAITYSFDFESDGAYAYA